MTLIFAAIAKRKIKKEKWPLILTSILSVGGLVTLWSSYSRSALIGTCIAIVIVLAVVVSKKQFIFKPWALIVFALVALIAGILAANNSSFVSNVLLHENPNGGSSVNSNEDHISSLQNGLNQAIHQPLGDGIGSTGSASLYGDSPIIIENQYLFTAHETGWLGLGLFVCIYGFILLRLWRLRKDWLALGVFASGIGLAVIGLLLPVWVDDTLSIIWFGLAAIALFPSDKVI